MSASDVYRAATAILAGDPVDELIEIVLADSNIGFDHMVDLWHASLESSVSDLSLSPEWTLRAAKSARLSGCLHMLGLRQRDGTLRAFGAFIEKRERMLGWPLRMRELPGNQIVAYHHEIPGDLIGKLVEAIGMARGVSCDVLYLPAVPRGGPTDSSVAASAERLGWTLVRYPGYRSPYIRIDGTWDAYLKCMSSNFRYTLKRKRRALEAMGQVSERWFASVDSVEDLMGCITRVESSSWKVEANMAITGSHQEESYYRSLLPWLARIGALSANVVFVDDVPVAYSLCYRWRGRVAQAKTSFDERFSDASPGLVVNTSAIQQAFETGAHEFDFLGDVMPHKMHWASDVRAHDHLFIFTSTPKGRMVGAAKWLVARLRQQAEPVTTGRGGLRVDSSRDAAHGTASTQ